MAVVINDAVCVVVNAAKAVVEYAPSLIFKIFAPEGPRSVEAPKVFEAMVLTPAFCGP